MDKLDIIFEMQKLLNEDIATKRNIIRTNDIKDKNEWAQKQILALFAETNELLNELNYKWWKNEKELNLDNIKEELVDVLHFFVSLCLTFDMTADELFDIYKSKNAENFSRQLGLSSKSGYKAESAQTLCHTEN